MKEPNTRKEAKCQNINPELFEITQEMKNDMAKARISYCKPSVNIENFPDLKHKKVITSENTTRINLSL